MDGGSSAERAETFEAQNSRGTGLNVIVEDIEARKAAAQKAMQRDGNSTPLRSPVENVLLPPPPPLPHFTQNVVSRRMVSGSRGHSGVLGIPADAAAARARAEKKSTPPLCTAAKDGKLNLVRMLLQGKANVNESDAAGNTPLHYAVQNGHEVVARELAKEGALLTALNKLWRMPVSRNWGEDKIRRILLMNYGSDKINADVRLQDVHGKTILHYAAELGTLRAMKKLLELPGGEAGIRVADYDRKTPLDYATAAKNKKLEDFLLCKLKDLQAISDKALRLLMDVYEGEVNRVEHRQLKQAIRALLQKLENDPEETTIFHRLATNVSVKGNPVNVFLLQAILAEFLRKSKPLVNEGDYRGRTPLHLYARGGQVEQVEILLQYGADRRKRDALGQLPLHYAARSGRTEVLDALLSESGDEDGADKDKMDAIYGQRSIHYAEGSGRRENLDALVGDIVKNGAERHKMDVYGQLSLIISGGTQGVSGGVNSKTTVEGRTGLHIAAAHGQEAAVRWFIRNKARVDEEDATGNTPLHLAVVCRNVNVAQLLVSEGADMCKLNGDGMMPLTYAEEEAMLRALMPTKNTSYGLPKNVKNMDVYDKSLMHYAANIGDLEVVKRLAESPEGDLQAEDRDQRSILYYATEAAGESELVEWLLNEGVDGAQSDKFDNTPLHIAAKRGNLEVARILLKKITRRKVAQDNEGILSKLFAENTHGMSPLLYALLIDHAELFELLRDQPCASITVDSIWWALLRDALNSSAPELDIQANEAAKELPAYVALHASRWLAFHFLLERGNVDVNDKDSVHLRTCLHWAVILKKVGAVQKLGKISTLKPNQEDKHGMTPVQYCMKNEDWEMREMLLQIPVVKIWEESLYADRQRFVDATNASLVGAALIAGLPFGGLTQLAPGGSMDILCPMDRTNMKVFWICNSMSCFFAMATILTSISAIFPMPREYIAVAVKRLRRSLTLVAILFMCSVVFVLCAFTSASIFALHHVFTRQKSMPMGTLIVGWLTCASIMVPWFIYYLRATQRWASNTKVINPNPRVWRDNILDSRAHEQELRDTLNHDHGDWSKNIAHASISRSALYHEHETKGDWSKNISHASISRSALHHEHETKDSMNKLKDQIQKNDIYMDDTSLKMSKKRC